VHPIVHVGYGPNVYQPSAEAAFAASYRYENRTVDQVVEQMRTDIYLHLVDMFGAFNVDPNGSKAVKLKGVAGSRVDADISRVSFATITYVFQHLDIS
jgi:hypothetical protein